jgi:hypothetical protein
MVSNPYSLAFSNIEAEMNNAVILPIIRIIDKWPAFKKQIYNSGLKYVFNDRQS